MKRDGIGTDDRLAREVTETIAAITGKAAAELKPGDALVEDLGLDSIQFVELLARLEERFGFEFETEELRPERFRTVRAVIRAVAGKADA